MQYLHQIPQPEVSSEQKQIAHNVAIAEYFRDCCRDPAKLLQDLQKIKQQLNIRSDALLSVCYYLHTDYNIIRETAVKIWILQPWHFYCTMSPYFISK